MKKGAACVGCPFYLRGNDMVPDRLTTGKVMVLAQNPGANEVRGERITSYSGGHPVTTSCEPQPLIGATGYVLEHTYLPLAGLERSNVSYANVIKCRVDGKNTLPTGEEYEKAVEHCTQAYLQVPPSVEVVVAMGAHALAHVTKESVGITEWRGYLLPWRWRDRQVYTVGHLADTFRDPVEKLNARSDWRRLGQYLSGRWPVAEPIRNLDWHVLPLDYGNKELPVHLGDTVYLDTEYHPNEEKPWLSKLQLIGLRVGGRTVQYVWPKLEEHERAEVREALMILAADYTVVVYNAAADLPILEHTLDIPREAWRHLEDPMLLHHELWSELKHGMQYTSSLYGVLAQPKAYRKGLDFYRYNMGDLVETQAIWEALVQECKEHPRVWDFYHKYVIPAIHIVTRAQERGLRVNPRSANELLKEYKSKVSACEAMAQAYVGYPLNVGSNPQMVQALTLFGGLKLRRGKHSKALSMEADAVADYRAKVHPTPDTDHEAEFGLSPEDALVRIADGAHPLLEARVAFASVNQYLTHYVNFTQGKERVHPRVKLHSKGSAKNEEEERGQASHRWSWVDPPMQNVPADLECLFGPDEGWVWFGWDWQGQEDWLHAAESNDITTLEALRQGLDLHTIKARQLFPELGDGPVDKKHPKRHFAKRYRHRFKFGATIDGLKTMPGCHELGINTTTLMQIMARDAAANPKYTRWRQQVAQRVGEHSYDLYQDIPTWSGRFRRTFERGGKLTRVAYNASQGGGADQLNRTVVELAKAFDRTIASLAFTAHDSGVLHVKASEWQTLAPSIAGIVEAPIEAWGHTLHIGADWWVQHTLGGPREKWIK